MRTSVEGIPTAKAKRVVVYATVLPISSVTAAYVDAYSPPLVPSCNSIFEVEFVVTAIICKSIAIASVGIPETITDVPDKVGLESTPDLSFNADHWNGEIVPITVQEVFAVSRSLTTPLAVSNQIILG